MDKILKVANVEKYYGNRSNLTKAIDNISFDVLEGEFVGIMGASGSGKTTLLNCISTIDKVTSGHILINGTDVTELKGDKLNKFRREDLGFIFQDFNLLDTLTGYENIAQLKATILMVTHDAFTASYCSKIYFIKDGKIFNELTRGDDSRKEFFDRIIDVVTLLGGDMNDAL